jgi:hypothetical protein
MNRSDRFQEVMRLEGLAAAARAAAAEHRIALNAEATAEYEREGMAPTWRWPDIGTVILPVSKEAPTVQDAAALVAWCRERYPSEVETLAQIRPAFQAALMKRAVVDGQAVVDPVTGEVMPGLGVRPGGVPKALAIRPTPEAEALFAAVGRRLLADLLGVPDSAEGGEQ